MVMQSDGKLLIGGSFTTVIATNRNRSARLNADGTLDASFTATGASSDVLSVALQSDGKVLIGGKFTMVNGVLRNRTGVVSNGLFTLSWGAISGRTYRVQYTIDSTLTNWTNLPPDIIATGTNITKTDTITLAQRFYRVALLP